MSSSTPGRTPGAAALAYLLVVGAIGVATLQRAFLGVDFADEAAYAALARRFLLGDRPFIDEINLIQTASFFTLPLVWIWTEITGGVDGLLLFLRLGYVVTCVMLAVLVARSLRPAIGGGMAVLLAAPVVAFVPLGIPTFCYNTLASLFFLAGIFFLFRAASGEAEGRRVRWSWVLAGTALAWSSFSIPTYALPAIVALACAVVVGGRACRARAAMLFACGAIVAIAVFTPLLLGFGAETLGFGYAYTGGKAAWIQKLGTIAWQAWRIVPAKVWITPALAVFCVLAFVGARSLATIVLAFVVAGLVPGRGTIDSSVHVFFVAMLGPMIVPFVWRSPLVKPLFTAVWLPSILAGIVAAWTSGNGIGNAGLGALPAAIVTLYSAAIYARTGRSGLRAEALGALVPVAFASALVFEQRHVFMNDAPEHLTARMQDGPFRGLYTTPEKKAWIDEVSSAIQEHAPGHDRILAVVHFPLVYLLTDLRPAARSTWGLACPPKEDWDCVERFEQDLEHFAAKNVLVVEILRLPYSSTTIVEHPVGAVSQRVRERFEPILEREGYALFVPR